MGSTSCSATVVHFVRRKSATMIFIAFSVLTNLSFNNTEFPLNEHQYTTEVYSTQLSVCAKERDNSLQWLGHFTQSALSLVAFAVFTILVSALCCKKWRYSSSWTHSDSLICKQVRIVLMNEDALKRKTNSMKDISRSYYWLCHSKM